MQHPTYRTNHRLACLALLAAAALVSGAGMASERTTDDRDDAKQNASASTAAPSDKICQRIRPIGSNIPQTVCRTRQQMDAEAAAARDALDANRTRRD